MKDWICYCRTWEQARNKADSIMKNGYDVEIRSTNVFGKPHYSIYRGRKKGSVIGYVNDEREAKLAVASFKNKGDNAWYVKNGDRYQILKGV